MLPADLQSPRRLASLVLRSGGGGFSFSESAWRIGVAELEPPTSITGGCLVSFFDSAGKLFDLCSKTHSSFVVGHLHIFSHAVQTISGASNKQTHGLSAGCLISEKDNHSWAGTSQHYWVRGACMLHRVENGSFDLEWWSLARIRETFG
jgi:hypothetical protein